MLTRMGRLRMSRVICSADTSLRAALTSAQGEAQYLKERYAEVLERERVLLSNLAMLQRRALHDFANLCRMSIKDTDPYANARGVLSALADAVEETGPEDLGTGECDCGKIDCPYKLQ